MVKSLPIAPVEHPWATIVVLLGAAVVFGAIPLALAWLWARLFSPAKPGLQKNATYECGLEAKGDAWVQLDVSYFLRTVAAGLFGDAGFPAVIGGGSDLGLPKRGADVGVMRFPWTRI
jgi:hypothetical protein